MARMLFVVLLCSCRFLPAPIPMAKIVEAQQPNTPAKCLFILLPGAGDHAATFREQGFVDQLQGTGWSVDLVAADATMGYYFKGIAAERIEVDVAAPSRLGQQQVWLIGTSMGGFGTFNYAMQYPDHVNGILAIAPYLGDKGIAQEVSAAGGLVKWAPDAKAMPLTEDNYQRQLWSYLHRVVTGDEQKAPSVYVGWGDADGLGKPDSLLAAALPADHVFHAPGGHDWPVWRNLLKQFLLTPEIKAACAR